MLAGELVSALVEFLLHLEAAGERFKIHSWEVTASAGRVPELLDPSRLPRPCAYWFFFEDGVVFDIGQSDTDVWQRIAAHANSATPPARQPSIDQNPSAEHQDHSGVTSMATGRRPSAGADAIHAGRFHVGWVAVEPSHVATLVEVYLKTFCLSADGCLPEYCSQVC